MLNIFVYSLINFLSFLLVFYMLTRLLVLYVVQDRFRLANATVGALCGCKVLLGAHHIYRKSIFNKQSHIPSYLRL
jgi:hypothetical protein